ncbi:response regulator [Thauera aminoaromatica]|uniref:Response regulator receiver modulated metal dependent phosphohydrolase n=1 Tax=Thauera aminoaromatica S2 TaxID=1234381 RepID=N6XQ26_THASP|nr:two-component system response regulator [Thauera aminoaromatica]ENO83791.1 response regulator receiver modulated metal dependent phosphohydrolase [Thauera aminoaromatica S2]
MLEHTLLIVDDEPANLAVLTHLLQPYYRVRAVNSGRRCLAAVRPPLKPDLILLDVMMPEMDGYEVLARLRADPATSDIPVLFVTALDDDLNEESGLARGAADYLTKPIRPGVLLARVRTQLEAKRGRDFLRDQNALLDAEVARRMRENELTQLVSIRALAHLAETRDPETGNHILRTQGYVHQLATALQRHPRFSDVLTSRYIDLLTKSAPLHDIGKVGIPDAILQKPGPLTPEEWAVMKTHAEIGAEAIDRAEADIETTVDFLVLAKEIAHWHHEKWDGSGYPDGLAAEAIPLSARLMALADVFDALISVRVYKPAMSYEEAREVILAGRGRHFDPDVVDAFLTNYAEFVRIAERYSDTAA